jgi:hypothetical protein
MRLLSFSRCLSRALPLLLAVAAWSTEDAVGQPLMPALGVRDLMAVDAQFVASLQQVTREQQALAQRLDASRRLVTDLFASEQQETLAFVRETRSKMLAIRASLREEMRAALAEVQSLLASTAADATAAIRQYKHVPDTAKPADAMPAINQTCRDDRNVDQSAGEQPSEPLVSWSDVQDGVARALVSLAHLYEVFAVAVVHYAVVVGLWVLLPAAAIVALLVLAAVAIARLQAYQRARRRPRVVYSGYLHSRRLPVEATDARKRNDRVQKA